MLIKEYRIPLPMSVDEYRIAQLYMIQVILVFDYYLAFSNRLGGSMMIVASATLLINTFTVCLARRSALRCTVVKVSCVRRTEQADEGSNFFPFPLISFYIFVR